MLACIKTNHLYKNVTFQLENHTFRGTGNSSCWVLGPKVDPKINQKTVKNGVKKWTRFWTYFSDFWAPLWVHFRSNFGVKEGHDAPKWTRERPQEP